LADDGLLI